LYTTVVLVALLIASGVQWAFHSFSLNGQVLMSPILHPYVWLLSIGIWLLCVFVNARIIRRLLFKLA
jgi:cytochrome b subunit of formate dehydrogenase